MDSDLTSLPAHNKSVAYLPWDSTFFGKRIAQIRKHDLSDSEVKKCIQWCRKSRVRCLYYLIKSSKIDAIWAAEDNGFHYVDTRVTLETGHPANLFAKTTIRQEAPIVREANNEDIFEIARIARSNHFQTRFFKDNHFSRIRSSELYGMWVEKGFRNPNGIVFVAQNGSQIAGYLLGSINERLEAEIGLTGVDNNFRNQGLGTTLINAALRWFAKKGTQKVRVVTQGSNIAALRLYSKCGFVPSESMMWYHRWFKVSKK